MANRAREAAAEVVTELLDAIGPEIVGRTAFIAEKMEAFAKAEAEATLLWADERQDLKDGCWCRQCWEEWWAERQEGRE